jgi:hypothetical protein
MTDKQQMEAEGAESDSSKELLSRRAVSAGRMQGIGMLLTSCSVTNAVSERYAASGVYASERLGLHCSTLFELTMRSSTGTLR